MIKKILLGLGLAFLGFINFSNAGSIQTVGLDPSNSIYDGNYKLTFLKGGGVLTNYFGQSKSVLSFVQSGLFWWYVDGKPYFYDNGFQGYFGEYWICDELTGENSIPVNCVSHPITGDFKATFKGFFSSVSAGDYAYYDYEPMDVGSSYYDNTVQVCWSSRTYHGSLCFRQHSCYNGRGCSAGNYGSLVGSKGLTLSFDLIQQAIIGYAPGQAGYDGGGNIDGGNSVVGDQNLTGDLIISEVGTGDAINYMQSADGFKPAICYVGTTDLNSPYGTLGISFEEGSGATIFDLYYDKFGVWSGTSYGLQYVANMIDARTINYYGWFLTDGNPGYQGLADFNGQIYERIYDTGSGFIFPFANKPVAYYFMANNVRNYSNYYGNSSHLIGANVVDYCNMILNGSSIDEMISPGLKNDILSNYNRNLAISENVYNWYLNLDGYTGSEWKADGSSWSGIFESGVVITDGVNFINTFFNTVKSNFQLPNKNGGQDGIIPSYIIVCLFALILFRLISH